MILLLLALLSPPAEASLEDRFRAAGIAAESCARETPGQECYELAVNTMSDYEKSRSFRSREFGGEKHDFPGPGAALQGHPTEKAYVLIHSYTMSPFELNAIGAELYAKGNNVIQVLLEGHGPRSVLAGGPVSLKDVKREDWKDDVHFGIQLAHALGKKVVLVGYSLGGILSILEGSKDAPEIAGFLAVAPPVALNDRIYGGPGACSLKKVLRAGLAEFIGKKVTKNDPYGKPYVAEFVNGACELLATMTDFNHVGRAASTINNAFRFEDTFRGERAFTDLQRADFHRLKVPYVIVASPHDDAVDFATLKRLVTLSAVPGQLFESNAPNHLAYGLARQGSADFEVFRAALDALDAATSK